MLSSCGPLISPSLISPSLPVLFSCLVAWLLGCLAAWLLDQAFDSVVLCRVFSFDEIWSPSDWGKELLVSNGVPRHKVMCYTCGIVPCIVPAPCLQRERVFACVVRTQPLQSMPLIGEGHYTRVVTMLVGVGHALSLYVQYKAHAFRHAPSIHRVRSTCALTVDTTKTNVPLAIADCDYCRRH